MMIIMVTDAIMVIMVIGDFMKVEVLQRPTPKPPLGHTYSLSFLHSGECLKDCFHETMRCFSYGRRLKLPSDFVAALARPPL